jgi:hypothetical protein
MRENEVDVFIGVGDISNDLETLIIFGCSCCIDVINVIVTKFSKHCTLLFFKQSIDNLRIIQRNKCRNKG